MIWRMQHERRLRRQVPLLEQEISNPTTQIPNKGSNPNYKMDDGKKPRDLEDRTFVFAESVRSFAKRLPRTIGNIEDVRQLIRASGSVAANWIDRSRRSSQ